MPDSVAVGRHRDPPVIVLGVGITALGVLRTLARGGITTLVAETADPLLRHSRWFRPLPRGTPPIGTSPLDAWLSALPLERAVLMPCSDHRVSEVASLPAPLRERFPAVVPAASTLARFVDKGHFAQLLQSTGTPHPFSAQLPHAEALNDVPDAVFADAILKPRDSQSFMQRYGVKALRVRTRRAAAEQLARVHGDGFAVILQEYVPGPATNHFFIDGFIDRHGTLRAVFVRRRLRMYPLDFGNSTALVSVAPDAARPAVDALTALLAGVGYVGIFSAEFKRDARDGMFRILEVNARPWWYVDFAARCGVDVCRMAYDGALGRAVPTLRRYQTGRTLVFPYYDRLAVEALHARGKLSFGRGLGSWVGAMQPVFQWQDPAPGIYATLTKAAGFVRRRLRRSAASPLPRRVARSQPVSARQA